MIHLEERLAAVEKERDEALLRNDTLQVTLDAVVKRLASMAEERDAALELAAFNLRLAESTMKERDALKDEVEGLKNEIQQMADYSAEVV